MCKLDDPAKQIHNLLTKYQMQHNTIQAPMYWGAEPEIDPLLLPRVRRPYY